MNDVQDAQPHSTTTSAPTPRRWSVRVLAATAITAVALSGAAGAALAAVSDRGSTDGGRGGFGGPPPGMTGLRNGLPDGTGQRPQRPAVPGQLPAATDPAAPSGT